MSETTFGERLAEARRIKGEAIEEVSEQLRIRPSIILAMETSNFSHMPHKGYARNMVSSYARYLGLDSTRLTEQFLREFRRWEGSGRPGSGVTKSVGSFPQVVKRAHPPNEEVNASGKVGSSREIITAAKRNRGRSSVWREESKRDTDKKFREQLRQAQDDKGLKKGDFVRRPAQRTTPSASPSTRQIRSNDYTGKPPRRSLFSGVSSGLLSRPIVLIIGLVVVFVGILILWAALASNCTRNDTANVPVTGVANSDSGLEEGTLGENLPDVADQLAEEGRYGPFELTVTVSGGDSWLLIAIDGAEQINEVCSAPWSGEYTVTATCKIQAGAPGYVKVFRNGIEVPIETVDGVGSLELAVEDRPIVQNAQDAENTQSTDGTSGNASADSQG